MSMNQHDTNEQNIYILAASRHGQTQLKYKKTQMGRENLSCVVM